MKHAYFHKAVQQAYERLIQIGTHVPYFIYFDVNPADIDVNIHPTKTEIKFENEQAIWQILAAAVKDAIGQFCEIPQIDFDTEGRPDIPAYSPVGSDHITAPKVTTSPQYNPFRQKPSQEWQRLYEGLPKETAPEEPALFPETVEVTGQASITDIAPTHYQYKGRYIMTAVKSGLMIIDQYRADVRIRYERYLHQLTEAPAQSQRLLFPEMVELSSAEAVLMTDLLPSLTTLGFEVTPIGPTTYAVNGVPAGIEGLQPENLLRDILTDATEHSGQTSQFSPLTSHLSLSLARHAAIPYGQLLSNDEMDTLVNDLFACENVNYTPDGRAILCILPQHDIEQLLG
jgi:DNA mismatch repair protein MutL